MTTTPETPVEAPAASDAPAAPPTRLPRRAAIAIIGLATAVLVAIVVIVVLTLPKGSTELAGAPSTPKPTATVSATPSATPTPTPTQAPVVAAPAPVEPAPVAPAPVAPAPAPVLPAPPEPVFIPAITSMNAVAQGACTTSTWVTVSWTATNALNKVSEINVRSGGGTPVFNQTWTLLDASGTQQINIDCTRPVWFFKLTVYSATASKSALLTFANGVDQGWSSN